MVPKRRPKSNTPLNNIKDEIIFGTKRAGRNLAALIFGAGESDPACSRVKRKEFYWLLDTKQQPKIHNEKKWVIYL